MNVYAYSRVSTNIQDSSTEQQADILKRFCEANGYQNTIYLSDTDVSGGKPIFERPQGRNLVMAQKGDIIVCAKHDRMFRSLRDAVNTISDWFEQGVSVYFLNLGNTPIDVKNPHSKFMLFMIMATAELEKDTIAERTIKNLKFRKDNKKTYSAAPYGWDNVGERNGKNKIVNGELIKNNEEQLVILKIKELYADEKSLGNIAGYLNLNKIKSKKGGEWSAKTVRDVILNDLNK